MTTTINRDFFVEITSKSADNTINESIARSIRELGFTTVVYTTGTNSISAFTNVSEDRAPRIEQAIEQIKRFPGIGDVRINSKRNIAVSIYEGVKTYIKQLENSYGIHTEKTVLDNGIKVEVKGDNNTITIIHSNNSLEMDTSIVKMYTNKITDTMQSNFESIIKDIHNEKQKDNAIKDDKEIPKNERTQQSKLESVKKWIASKDTSASIPLIGNLLSLAKLILEMKN